MRLDLFLKKTTIIKRRTVAKEIVIRGLVTSNNKVLKPSSEILNDQILKLELGTHVIEVKAIIETKNNKEIVSFVLLSDEKLEK